MDFLAITNAVVVTLGVPTLIGSSLYIGRKLQILDSLHETTCTIKHNLTIITHYLTKNHKNFNSAELKAFSPLQLTESGRKLVKDIGFEDIFTKNKEKFFAFIASEKPKLKYDVERSSIRSIIAFSEESFMEPLKIFFYNNPERSLDDVSPTLGVYIRDKYLSEHTAITQ